MSPTPRLYTPLATLAVLAGGVAIFSWLGDRGGSRPSAEEASCPPEAPGCVEAPTGTACPAGECVVADRALEAEPTELVDASRICIDAGYLCAALEREGEIRVVRFDEERPALRIRVPRPAIDDPARAAALQRAAVAGLRAWHARPFPLRIDRTDRPGDHDIVVRWTPSLGGRRLGRTRTRWSRRGGEADLEVVDFALVTHDPFDPQRPLRPAQVELTAAHEMGHALGIPHSDDRRDVMFPENTATRLTARDYKTMTALYDLENGALIR